MDLKQLGAAIRDKRERLGIPPAVLARKAGIGRTTLWILERGEHPKTGKPSRPAKDLLERLGATLRLEPAELHELLELAGYQTERPGAQAAGALPPRGASAPGDSISRQEFMEALTMLHRQLAADFKAELRQAIQELARERASLFPHYYPAVTLDRFWYVIAESDAHMALQSELAQQPVSAAGSHFLELFFWPSMRQAMEASGQWLPRVIRTIRGFQSMLESYLREAPQRRHEYDALIERLSARLPDFAHVYTAAQQVVMFLPERSLAPQHISTTPFHLPLRPAGAVDLIFHSMLTLARGDFSEQTLTLVPANDETRAALILLCLAHEPLLAGHSDDPHQQALWWLSAIRTVEDGLMSATLDRWWEPQATFGRLRSELVIAAAGGQTDTSALLEQIRATIQRLESGRALSGAWLMDALLHFTGNPAALAGFLSGAR